MLRATQLEVELPCAIVMPFVDSFLPFSKVAPGVVEVLSSCERPFGVLYTNVWSASPKLQPAPFLTDT
jgi:hypothetical protein